MSELSERIGLSYDELPYLSGAFPQSTPEHLHAVAHLFGLATPPPGRARVLELGCAAGGNLIPFASRYPLSRTLGIDISSVQVRSGNRAIRKMGLRNIRLLKSSITEIEENIGTFDYIICHGVYSWVPADVREAILRIGREHLNPNGVAYVSYNTYPGWKAKEIIRDAMLMRGEAHASSLEKLSYARGMVEFLHDMAGDDSLLKKVMKEGIQIVRHGDAHYVAHEYLELCNAPCYFRDFVESAGRHGLAYLAESEVPGMFASNYDERISGPLLRECGGSQVALEQMLDFLNNRTFRQTLLVRAERAGDIRYQLDAERLRALHVAGLFAAVPVDAKKETPRRWETSRGIVLRFERPLENDLIGVLNEAWPATVPVASLIRHASALPGVDAATAEDAVLNLVEHLILTGAVRARLGGIQQRHCDDAPYLPGSLRQLATLRASEEVPIALFNAWHEPVALQGPVEAVLAPLMDGKHGMEALAAALYGSALRGELSFQRAGVPILGEVALLEAAREHAAAAIGNMAARGLFVTTSA